MEQGDPSEAAPFGRGSAPPEKLSPSPLIGGLGDSSRLTFLLEVGEGPQLARGQLLEIGAGTTEVRKMIIAGELLKGMGK